jgi:hypothetical protein
MAEKDLSKWDRLLNGTHLAVFLGMVLNLCLFASTASGEIFSGQAVNRQGKLEYVECHRVGHENGKIIGSRTVYYDPDNEKIGEMISEYSHGPQFGSYDFRDIRGQYQDGAKVEVDHIQLFRKESPDNDMEATYIPRESDQIVGQGFHQFVVHNLEPIAQGKIFHVRLILPSRLDQYKFRIRKRKIVGDTLYIRLEVDNWLLRLLAPHMDVEYDLKTARLKRYEGVSNLKDASGKHKKVTITYTYQSETSCAL